MSDINRAIQPQVAGGLKFWIWEVEGLFYPCSGLFYPCSENKSTDQLRGSLISFAVTAKLICVFFLHIKVFLHLERPCAYTKSRFSHDTARLSSLPSRMISNQEKDDTKFLDAQGQLTL